MSRASIRGPGSSAWGKGPSSRPQARQMRTYWPSGAPTALQRCIPSRQRSACTVDVMTSAGDRRREAGVPLPAADRAGVVALAVGVAHRLPVVHADDVAAEGTPAVGCDGGGHGDLLGAESVDGAAAGTRTCAWARGGRAQPNPPSALRLTFAQAEWSLWHTAQAT